MQFTIHAAKTQLSKLIEAALAGEDVIIAKGSMPVVRIVPVRKDSFRIGVLEGKVTTDGPDFLEPMENASLDLWEGR